MAERQLEHADLVRTRAHRMEREVPWGLHGGVAAEQADLACRN